ncbi:gluconate 2-dehydrogenase [Clostridium sp. USBA 49]|jgi:gluconate 2-dehydrogenase|uniref:2-hydroxyacid dehydrogenase n=1 Tax=Clostridium TaxID=1485 RepID=UPI00099AABDC|nr:MULTISPECIES: D-glycerate dehydrogenase [Clostridium]SKA78394.1 gluconate 2-dehydrogenase [Clostridium sp. USBA 49]
MIKPKVYIEEKLPKKVLDYIGTYCEYEMWQGDGKISRKELLQKISDKDGIILMGRRVDEEFLNAAPKLKVVSNVSVGYNNFDLEAMKKRKIIGTNTPYVLDDTVADLIFGLILSSARRIPELDRYVKEGKWESKDSDNLFGIDVHHKNLGIIGMGRIGEKVAKRAKLGFDMEVFYYNRNRKKEAEEKIGAKYCDMNTLLKISDFIVLMTPLTKETYHLIDAEEFNLMKSTAIFINASRGQTVNEKALIEALKNKKIFGAGLDVFEIEPVKKDNELLNMPNVITLPHIGSATEKTRFDMAMLAAENLVKGVLGEKVPNIVPELL